MKDFNLCCVGCLGPFNIVFYVQKGKDCRSSHGQGRHPPGPPDIYVILPEFIGNSRHSPASLVGLAPVLRRHSAIFYSVSCKVCVKCRPSAALGCEESLQIVLQIACPRLQNLCAKSRVYRDAFGTVLIS